MKIPNPFHPDQFTPSSICSATDEGGGDGGGGGGDPMADATRDLILRTVNAAVTSQLSRKLPQAITDGVTAAMQPIQDQLGKLVGGAGDGDGGAGGNGKGDTSDPRVAKLLKEQDAMKAQLAAERKAREDQAREAAEQRRNSQLQNILQKTGVEPLRMKGAMAEVLANIQQSEDGQVFYRTNRNGYDEDLALEDGIRAWADSDVGKSYMAPKNVNGSGASAPGRQGGPRPGKAPLDPAAAKAQRMAEARTELHSQVKSLLGGGTVTLGGGNAGPGDGSGNA